MCFFTAVITILISGWTAGYSRERCGNAGGIRLQCGEPGDFCMVYAGTGGRGVPAGLDGTSHRPALCERNPRDPGDASGARPKWLADKYPEVLRVDKARRRQLFGVRHNHCYTSPVYREKVRIINQKLAERFGNHPAVIMWHISNEYGGECHCPLCQAAFRDWLKEKYQTIGNLNSRWCTTFWSHTYQSFDDTREPL